MAQFKKIVTDNLELQKVQDEVARTFRELQAKEFASGVFVESVAIAGSSVDTVVNHGLGRRYRGFVPTKPNAAALIYESSTSNPRKELQIILKSSAAVTVDLYVF